ncbi:MAG: prepilin-type N-terminal cleavage/methylation domain-containing protein [Planctomycetota bacterium]
MCTLTAKYPKGFTLVEALVASMLLLLALVPILKALTSTHTADARIEKKICSLNLAEFKLEQIRAESIYKWHTNFKEKSVSLSGSYLCSVTDEQVQGILFGNLRSIGVSVGYDSNNNKKLDNPEIEVTLDTYIAKRW